LGEEKKKLGKRMRAKKSQESTKRSFHREKRRLIRLGKGGETLKREGGGDGYQLGEGKTYIPEVRGKNLTSAIEERKVGEGKTGKAPKRGGERESL